MKKLSFHNTSIILLFICSCITFIAMPNTISGGVIFTSIYDTDKPEINSFAAILIDADSGDILYGKDIDSLYYPASITKIMTALLAVEHYDDYEKRISFSWKAVNSLPYDSSSIWMKDGETLSVDEAMYGLMLASANDVANAIAEDIAGSIEDFTEMMNKRASELGTINTNFENPHGLFGEHHYTTARDMALIMREAVKHPEFRRYISTKRYNIQPTEQYNEIRYMANSNKMIMDNSDFYNKDVIGGKTGYIDESKHTLVVYAARGDVRLITAILYGEKNEPYIDTKSLLDYGFGLYE